MRERKTEYWVGLFVLAGLAALVFLALKVGNWKAPGSDSYYTVVAKFDNIGGLKSKAPVTLAGVQIGRVGMIEIDIEEFVAVVELNIADRYNTIPLDTSASILTSGLLGAQYVGLDPGGEEEYLVNGTELELTQSAVVLEQLIGQLIFSKAAGDE